MKTSFRIQPLSSAAFRPYGRMIHYPGKSKKSPNRNLFRIVLTASKAAGWRIAYLIVRDKKIIRLEQHPVSFESFEPLRGRSLLFVARDRRTEAIRCFRLDRPVIVNKKIWHGIITLDKECEVKLTENARVKCLYWRLGFSLPLNAIAAREKGAKKSEEKSDEKRLFNRR